LNETGFAQAQKVGIGMVAAVADDNVVEHLDAHDLAGTDELFGDLGIFGRGCWIAGGMIMRG
jgi:hypothetical protein